MALEDWYKFSDIQYQTTEEHRIKIPEKYVEMGIDRYVKGFPSLCLAWYKNEFYVSRVINGIIIFTEFFNTEKEAREFMQKYMKTHTC